MSPYRAVAVARLKEGRASLLGPDIWRRARWWQVTLECGHETTVRARYAPRDNRYGRLSQRNLSDVLPAPARARCHECGEAS